MNKSLITICARGGSEGIPGKNIKPIAGKPLIAYAISFAHKLASEIKADIELSTDSADIKRVSHECGLNSEYRRPNSLATAAAGKIDTIADVLTFAEKKNNSKYEFIVDLDVTSPLRTLNDVSSAFELLLSKKDALNVFSVSPANRNPYFNMVEMHEDGFARVVKHNSGFTSRQQAPDVYDMNASFYIFRREFFEKNLRTSTTDKSLAFVMDHICFDIDHPHDFMFMEYLLTHKLLDFKL